MKKTSRIISVILILVLLFSVYPSVYASSSPDLLNISFDDEATNAVPDSVSLTGSGNNRVIEFGERNKVLSLSSGYVANTASILLPDTSTLEKYVLEFEVMFQKSTTGGAITLISPSGAENDFLSIDEEGGIFNTSGKKLTSISKASFNKISVIFDKTLKTYSVCFNGKCAVRSWNMAVGDYSMLQFVTESNKKDCLLLLDNVRVYEGDVLKKNTAHVTYNEEKLDFEEIDECNLKLNTYACERMDEGNTVTGVSVVAKSNKITHEIEGTNGFTRLRKLDTQDSLYIEKSVPATSKKVVVEFDLRIEKCAVSGNLMYMTFSTGSSTASESLVDIKNSEVYVKGKTKPISSNEWHRIGAIFNMSEHTYDVYVDGALLSQDVALNVTYKALTKLRVFVNATAEPGATDVDNILIYEGEEFREDIDAEIPEVSIFSDKSALSALANNTALSPYANKIYVNKKKVDTDVPCINEGDESLISPNTFELLFGVKPVVSGSKITVGNAQFTIGEKTMQYLGKQIDIPLAPAVVNGVVMIPADAYGKYVLGAKYYNDLHGMLMVSQSDINTSNTSYTSPLRDAGRYMLFDRYTASELLDKIKSNLNNDLTVHPRVLANKNDLEVLKAKINTDRYLQGWKNSVLADADQYVAKGDDAVPDYNVSTGRLDTGAGEALPALSMAYQLSGDKKYAECAINAMLKLCNYPDWYPQHHLGTSEIEWGIAIAFDWCYDLITDEQKEIIYNESKKKGFVANCEVFYGSASYSNNFWGRTDTNWGGVVNGGIIPLCLSITEMDPEYTTKVLEQSLFSIEYPISEIGPDGAWHEGPGYWSYFLSHLCQALAAYESVIGEVNKGVYQKGMIGMCEYQTKVSDPLGYVGVYNDMTITSNPTIECSGRLYIAKKLGLDNIMKAFTDNIDQFNTKLSTGATTVAMLWYDTSVTDSTTVNQNSLDAYFRQTELMTMRQAYNDKNALWVMADGGSSNASHSHLDSGSFQFTLGGHKWAIDLGREDGSYSRDGKNYAVNAGFTNNHYYRRKTEGHNCVVINPDKDVEMDQKAFAKMNAPVSGIGRAYASVDLTDAYTQARAKKYIRGYMLSEGRRAFTVRDEIDLAQPNSEVWWFMHTDGIIDIIDNNTAVISHGGKQLKLQFVVDGDNASFELMSMPQKRLIDLGFAELINSGEKVALKIKATGKLNITVKATMFNDPQSYTPVDTTPIAQWTVEGDDTIAPTTTESCEAKLDGIAINGKSIAGFNPDQYRWSYYAVDKGAINVEPISQYRTEVSLASEKDDVARYHIKAYDAAGHYSMYILDIDKSGALSADGYDFHYVIGADVSSEQTTETTSQNNLRTGSYDRDLQTRWSALGDGEWIVHDLGEVKAVDALAIAFYSGNSRTYKFDIQVSEDGVNYTDVLTGISSSGKTEGIELYTFGTRYNVRYIKFIGHGNSVNLWNNVTELISMYRKEG